MRKQRRAVRDDLLPLGLGITIMPLLVLEGIEEESAVGVGHDVLEGLSERENSMCNSRLA